MIVLTGCLTGCKDIEDIHFNAELCKEMWSDTIKVQCQNCRKREEEGQ